MPLKDTVRLTEVVAKAKTAGDRVRSLFPATGQLVATDFGLRQGLGRV